MKHDLVYCLRIMRRSPVFTGVAVVTLALAIGADTAILSLADALFRRPIPGADSRGVVGIYASFGDRIYEPSAFAWDEYASLVQQSRTLTQVAAHYSTSPLTLTQAGDARIVAGAVVSASYFRLLRIRPAAGRFFNDEEDRARTPAPVAVLSFRAWHEWFSGDPGVIGRTLMLNGAAFTVVGVAPPAFRGAQIGEPNDVWIPLSTLAIGYRFCGNAFASDCRILALLGGLAPGRTLEEAQAEMTVLGQRLASQRDARVTFGAFDGAFRLELRPLRGVAAGTHRDDHRKVVALLLAAGVLLLLVACANLAGMLLVRGVARYREIAIRRAIGASPSRIVRQLAIEGVALALLGAGAGLLVAIWLQAALESMYLGARFPYGLRLSPMVMASAALLALMAGLAFGVGPAVQVARADPGGVLRGDARAGGRARTPARDILLALQIALACLGLVSAGMLVQSMRNVLRDALANAAHVVGTRVRPGLVGYDTARARPVLREIVARLESVPGVQSVTLAGTGEVWFYGFHATTWLPGHTPPAGTPQPEAAWKQVGPRFFETLGIPLVAGRAIDDRDIVGSPRVVVVNEALARRQWPDASPIGQPLVVDGAEATVIGVVRDHRVRRPDEAGAPVVYTAFWQDPTAIEARFAVRVTGDPAATRMLLQTTARAVDPAVPVSDVEPVQQAIADAYRSVRLAGSAVSYAGILAMLLSALGLYGVLAFTVATRSREIAVRVALGARHSDVARAVYGHALRIVAIGVVAGLAASWVTARLMASFLYGARAASPLFAVLAVLALGAVSIVAAAVPLRRALRVQPHEALVT